MKFKDHVRESRVRPVAPGSMKLPLLKDMMPGYKSQKACSNCAFCDIGCIGEDVFKCQNPELMAAIKKAWPENNYQKHGLYTEADCVCSLYKEY